MGRILIIKMGSTLQSLRSEKGDFDDWILSGMQVRRDQAIVADVRNGATLPGHDQVTGVVIGGSHAMVTEHQGWSERTAAWLRGAVERGTPALGICYGHQLLAYALGGEVGDNPNGLEFGTVEVRLNGQARRDRLLGGFSSPIRVHVSHVQSVLRLPEGATLLASSDMDANQAFVAGDAAWGVQFHPEFDVHVVRTYIDQYRATLLEEGKQPDRLIETCTDTPNGAQVLERFASIVREEEQRRT